MELLDTIGKNTVNPSLLSFQSRFVYAVVQGRSEILHISLEKQGVSCKPWWFCVVFFFLSNQLGNILSRSSFMLNLF